eukprot:3189800-Pleurochrysis_carterae.AAC.1
MSTNMCALVRAGMPPREGLPLLHTRRQVRACAARAADFAPADSVSAAPREANHDDDGGDDVWALGDDDWLLDSGLDDIALAPLTDADAGA